MDVIMSFLKREIITLNGFQVTVGMVIFVLLVVYVWRGR